MLASPQETIPAARRIQDFPVTGLLVDHAPMRVRRASRDTIDCYWTTGLIAGTVPLFHLGATQGYGIIQQLRVQLRQHLDVRQLD